MRVDAAQALGRGPCSHAARDSLIISERFRRIGVTTAEEQVIHSARARAGDALRERLGERAQHDVYDTL